MKKYYIKGDKERGAEVIALLKSKGGLNKYHHDSGNNTSCYYYIDKDNCIRATSILEAKRIVRIMCEELTLPEKWIPKFKIGDKVYSAVIMYASNVKIADIHSDHTYRLSFGRNNEGSITLSEDKIKLQTW